LSVGDVGGDLCWCRHWFVSLCSLVWGGRRGYPLS
jgi:hypothetical protein